MPITQPCQCAPPGMPNFFASYDLSASPIGRGAWVQTQGVGANAGIIYFATGGASLLRFNTATNAEIAPLVVVGATSLRGVVWNNFTNRLYSIDQTGGVNQMRKINPDDGTSAAFVPGANVSKDICVNSLGAVTFSGTGTSLTTMDFADGIHQSGLLGADVAAGLCESNITTQLMLVALSNGIATQNPGDFSITKNNNGVAYAAVSSNEGKMVPTTRNLSLAGRAVAGANSPIQVDAAGAITLTAIAGTPNKAFTSAGFCPTKGVHAFVDSAAGVVHFFSETATLFGRYLGKYGIGACTAGINDSFPVVVPEVVFVFTNPLTGIYIPAGTAKVLNHFK